MTAANVTLIANPTSGGFSTPRIEEVVARLRTHGLDVELRLTAHANDAPRLACEACKTSDAPFVIAAGGDGTVNGVLNGLTPGMATLAVLPLGTANVLARELGIASLDDAVARIVRGHCRPLTVGRVQSGVLSRYFVLMAGAGFDGAVVEGVRLPEKRLAGKGAYLISALRVLRHWEYAPLEVVCDERPYCCHSAIVCNAARYGGNFRLAPGADLFDPLFRVVCVAGNRRRDLLDLVWRVVTGRPAGHVLHAREVRISGRKPLQLDGDYCCHTPATITAVANFAQMIV